jgi:SIR2-like domain
MSVDFMKNEVIANIKNIVQAKEQNRLVVFAGAGVSKNSDIPFWSELIKQIQSQITISDNETDQLKIAQLFYNLRDKKEYYDYIKKILLYKKAHYNPINEAILSLNPQHIITTNYDDLFEQVIHRDSLQYDVIRQDSDFPNANLSTYLIKMHGCFETQNIVLTENDYLKYSQNFPLIESYLKGLFASRLVVFLGFSFSDINLKYIIQRVDSVLGNHKQPSYIYLDSPYNDLERNYLRNRQIIPIYFDEINKYLDDYGFESSKALNERGNKLFRFVNLLNKPTFDRDEFRKLPIIKQISRALEPFHDFGFIMPTVYSQIPPFNEQNQFNKEYDEFGYSKSTSNCIILENPALLNLLQNIIPKDGDTVKKIKSLDKLKSENGENLPIEIAQITNHLILDEPQYNEFIKSLQTLNRSRIGCINRQYNIWVEDIERQCNCLSCRYKRLEFDKIIDILHKIEFKNEDISDSNDELANRLLKGYIAAKMGLCKVAFDELQKVVELAKSQNRPVPYFFAKYNLKYLWKFYWDDADNLFLSDVAKNIDLKDILNGLKVTNEVRNELEALITDKYIYEYLNHARKMKEDITNTFNLFSRGGSTSGNYKDDIYILINNLLVLHGFYQKNHILDTEFNLYAEFTETCFEAIICNYITPNAKFKNVFGEYRKLQTINTYILQSVILYCNPTKLNEILNKLNGKEIKITVEEKEDFIASVINFFKSFYTDFQGDISKNKKVLKNSESIFNVLTEKFKTISYNLILLLGHIELEKSDFESTIDPFLNFISVHNFNCFDSHIYWEIYLSKNIKKFSFNQQFKLLEQMIFHFGYVNENLVKMFSYNIHKDGIILINDLSFIQSLIEKDKKRYELNFIYHLFPISNEDVKKSISEKVAEMLTEHFESLDFYKAVGLKILEPTTFFKQAFDEAKRSLTHEFDPYNFPLSNFLHFVGRNIPNITQESFEIFINSNDYIKWLFVFDSFDYSTFDYKWFEHSPTLSFLPRMAKSVQVVNTLEQYLKENYSSENYKNLSKIYFNYFIKP